MNNSGSAWSLHVNFFSLASPYLPLKFVRGNTFEKTYASQKRRFALFSQTALERASNICRQADVVCALTLEVLKGTTRAFDGGK